MAEFMGFLLMVFLIFQDILVREEDDGSAEKTISRKQKINSGPDQNPNENDMWREPIFSGAHPFLPIIFNFIFFGSCS